VKVWGDKHYEGYISSKSYDAKNQVVPLLNELSTASWRRMGEGQYSSTILDLGSRWRWVVSFTPWRIYPRGKSTRCPLDRRLGGPQCLYGRLEVENISCPCRESNPDRPVRNPLPNSLSYHGDKLYCTNILWDIPGNELRKLNDLVFLCGKC
jgi:hypothetical protein